MRAVFAAFPGEKRLAQAGAWCKDGDVCLFHRRSCAEGFDIFRPEFGNRTRNRFEIIQEMDGLEIQRLSNGGLVHDPGQVRDLRSPRKYRTGDAEARPVDLQSSLRKELFRDGLQASVVRAVDLRFRQGCVRSPLLGKNTERGLGSTDIACN